MTGRRSSSDSHRHRLPARGRGVTEIHGKALWHEDPAAVCTRAFRTSAALVRGVYPSIIQTVYNNLLMCAGGTLGVAVVAGGVTFALARRSR